LKAYKPNHHIFKGGKRLGQNHKPLAQSGIKAILREYIRNNFLFIPIYSSLFQRIFVTNRRQFWH